MEIWRWTLTVTLLRCIACGEFCNESMELKSVCEKTLLASLNVEEANELVHNCRGEVPRCKQGVHTSSEQINGRYCALGWVVSRISPASLRKKCRSIRNINYASFACRGLNQQPKLKCLILQIIFTSTNAFLKGLREIKLSSGTIPTLK
ncbi:hypothetical protein GOBAR_AA00572 [Gossypium barbadense]|uniref:Secreted protein n=2 Tax=Gossypium TaxID=3633 RepID=A0A2P5YWP3_GOSBA|nr:hypothetical protein GOBAR_AA00572 [Gossypium barbadense]TYI23597.1 hypothetical protein ES332_A06G175400v1 [Gossypium tomentosum]